jgi:hypothetical protein
MTAGECIIVAVYGVWCVAAVLIVYRQRIKFRFVRRMNDDWMENGSSPWHVRAIWWVLRPFVAGW